MGKRKRGKCLGLIHLEIFNLDVAVFGRDADRVKVLRGEGCSPDSADPAAIASAHLDFTQSGSPRLSMVIKPEATRATWAHECGHIADFVMNLVGTLGCREHRDKGLYGGHLFARLEHYMGRKRMRRTMKSKAKFRPL